MKITIYELLGMIKDGNIPKKIKYDNDIWEYIEEKENYTNPNGASLNWDYVVLYCLKEPVEIIEEPQEHKIPKKLKLYAPYPECEDTRFEDIECKINEIIDCLEEIE